jgi:hypothetical protein
MACNKEAKPQNLYLWKFVGLKCYGTIVCTSMPSVQQWMTYATGMHCNLLILDATRHVNVKGNKNWL